MALTNKFLTFVVLASAYEVVLVLGACSADGFMCRAKCKELVRCTSTSNETFVDQVVRRCPGTIAQFCNATALDCSGDSCQDSGLDTVVLSCYENGVFPHPTLCNQYYSCINSTLVSLTCPTNTSYNALTQNCTASMNARSCKEGPIPRCESLEQIGSYPEDVTIFYMCAYDLNGYLRPQFHRCETGNIFSEERRYCVYDSSSTMAFASASIVLAASLIWVSISF